MTSQSSPDSLVPAMHDRRRVVVASAILLPVSFILALALGTIDTPFWHVVQTLFGQGQDARLAQVIEGIRLPRALLAAAVGSILGICGACTQGLFRNPLADPSLIGVTAGASAGAALVIFFAGAVSSSAMQASNGWLGLGLISAGAFTGGALAVLLVYRLATRYGRTSVATMLLAGIAITALAGGMTSLVEFFADNEMLRRISLWRMGGLNGANAQRVSVALLFAALMLVLLPRYSTALNALLLGESQARYLGIEVQRTKYRLIIIVAAGVATSVALAGSIAFVGLVVPHIVRLMIGPDHRYLLPLSAVGGAILLLLADTLARTVLAPVELPVGLVTAFLGAPFFISLLRQRTHYGAL